MGSSGSKGPRVKKDPVQRGNGLACKCKNEIHSVVFPDRDSVGTRREEGSWSITLCLGNNSGGDIFKL